MVQLDNSQRQMEWPGRIVRQDVGKIDTNVPFLGRYFFTIGTGYGWFFALFQTACSTPR